MAPDWTYDAAEAFQSWMNQFTLLDVVPFTAVGLAFSWLFIAVHEAGHAAAAHLRGLPVRGIRIGFRGAVRVRIGELTIELGPWIGGKGPAGWVRYDTRGATVLDVLIIASAGPLASAAAAIAVAWLTRLTWGGGMVTAILAVATVEAVIIVVRNLVPRYVRPGRLPNDGMVMRLAWRARTASVDPRTESSFPPPSAALASDPDP